MLELINCEIYEFCMLDIVTGDVQYHKPPKILEEGYRGTYFKDDNTFFALYSSVDGPKIFYGNKEYAIVPQLTIVLLKEAKQRCFIIEEYNIQIHYQASKYLNLDVWSTEMDVDVFYNIEQSYKAEEFYEKYTLKE